MILLSAYETLKNVKEKAEIALFIVVLLYCVLRFWEYYHQKKGRCFAYLLLAVVWLNMAFLYKAGVIYINFTLFEPSSMFGFWFTFIPIICAVAFCGVAFENLKKGFDDMITISKRDKRK